MPATHVYALFVSGSPVPFYVGITTGSLEERLSIHIHDRTSNPHRWNVQQKAVRNGACVEIVELLACGTWEEACQAERELIRRYRVCGYPLTNLTDGGEGTPGYQFTDAQKQHLSAVTRARGVSDATLRRLHDGGRREAQSTSGRERRSVLAREMWASGRLEGVQCRPDVVAKKSIAQKRIVATCTYCGEKFGASRWGMWNSLGKSCVCGRSLPTRGDR